MGKRGWDLSEGSINQSKNLTRVTRPSSPRPLNWQSFLIWKMKIREADIFISHVFFDA